MRWSVLSFFSDALNFLLASCASSHFPASFASSLCVSRALVASDHSQLVLLLVFVGEMFACDFRDDLAEFGVVSFSLLRFDFCL